MTTSTPPVSRYAGLDGLRALAVLLVVFYHLFPGSPLRSGFVGVDVFFVISGFLITTLLLRMPRISTRNLIDFWRRRARRLLPALAVVITTCATAALLIGGDVLVQIGRQIFGAATFSYNWISLSAGADYFSATSPELFRNVWSLALEEQFYLLWPLVVPLVLLLPWRIARTAIALVAAALSAFWMAQLALSGAVTRAYFGTDSHAFGLLLGIALAFLLWRVPRRTRPRNVVTAMGVLGVTAVLVAAILPETAGVATFPGALLLASAGTAVAIAASTAPGSRLGAALDIAPLRWLGNRSYGIYLWHWPLLVLCTAGWGLSGTPAGVPLAVSILVLVLTVCAAALSYRFIEMPIRRVGFRRTLRNLGGHLAGSPRTRFAGLAILAAAVLGATGTAASVMSSPTQSSAASLIEAGEQALRDNLPSPSSAPNSVLPGSSFLERAAAEKEADEERRRREEEARAPVTGAEITAIGDSVMLASAPALFDAFPGIVVDAAVSRQGAAGPDLIAQLASSGQLREYVVVALGTNGPVDESVLEELRRAIGPDRHLILVTAYAPRDWVPGVNAEIADFARSHPDVGIADWAGAIAPHPDYLAGDGIHPDAAGSEVFVTTMKDTVQKVAAEERRLVATPTPRP